MGRAFCPLLFSRGRLDLNRAVTFSEASGMVRELCYAITQVESGDKFSNEKEVNLKVDFRPTFEYILHILDEDKRRSFLDGMPHTS
jgi:hypothetical protein